MKRCFFSKVVVMTAVLSIFLPTALAHQPRLVGDETELIVTLPEISKAYYGNLTGKPVIYHIEAKETFRLYVNILVPDIQGIEKDVSVKILKDDTVISVLDADSQEWTYFYEPYAGDAYFQGPEYSQTHDPGIYEIQVYSPDNYGKYVLAIGDREAFPLKEMVKAYLVLPRLKSEFFGKSPLTAFSNRMGIFLVMMLIIMILIATVLFLVIRCIRKRSLLVKMKSDINYNSS